MKKPHNDSIGNTTVQRVKFERNRINTTSEEWNLKSKFHEAEGRVKFGFQISLFTSGIYEVEFKFHELLVVFPMNTTTLFSNS